MNGVTIHSFENIAAAAEIAARFGVDTHAAELLRANVIQVTIEQSSTGSIVTMVVRNGRTYNRVSARFGFNVLQAVAQGHRPEALSAGGAPRKVGSDLVLEVKARVVGAILQANAQRTTPVPLLSEMLKAAMACTKLRFLGIRMGGGSTASGIGGVVPVIGYLANAREAKNPARVDAYVQAIAQDDPGAVFFYAMLPEGDPLWVAITLKLCRKGILRCPGVPEDA